MIAWLMQLFLRDLCMKRNFLKLSVLAVALSSVAGLASAGTPANITVSGAVSAQTCDVKVASGTSSVSLPVADLATLKSADSTGPSTQVSFSLENCSGDITTAGDVVLQITPTGAHKVGTGDQYFGGTTSQSGAADSDKHLGIKVVNKTTGATSSTSGRSDIKLANDQVKPGEYALIAKEASLTATAANALTGSLDFMLAAVDGSVTAGMSIDAPITLTYAYL